MVQKKEWYLSRGKKEIKTNYRLPIPFLQAIIIPG